MSIITNEQTPKLKKQALKYFGGKWTLAPWIISQFPKHKIYVEPFGGGANVLLRKPASFNEVYNDLDGEIVNVFRCLQDRQLSDELLFKLKSTPFARDEFNLAYEPTTDNVERARRIIIKSMMGFGSTGAIADHKIGFNFDAHKSKAKEWVNYIDSLHLIVERMKYVIIDNRSAINVIKQYDDIDTLFYCDPPYVHDSRLDYKNNRIRGYRHEMTNEQHIELSELLHSLKGFVVLSGYRSALYDELYADWQLLTKESITATNKGGVKTIECLWLSPRVTESQIQMKLSLN